MQTADQWMTEERMRAELAALVNRCGGRVVIASLSLRVGDIADGHWIWDGITFRQPYVVTREATREEFNGCSWPGAEDPPANYSFYEISFD